MIGPTRQRAGRSTGRGESLTRSGVCGLVGWGESMVPEGDARNGGAPLPGVCSVTGGVRLVREIANPSTFRKSDGDALASDRKSESNTPGDPGSERGSGQAFGGGLGSLATTGGGSACLRFGRPLATTRAGAVQSAPGIENTGPRCPLAGRRVGAHPMTLPTSGPRCTLTHRFGGAVLRGGYRRSPCLLPWSATPHQSEARRHGRVVGSSAASHSPATVAVDRTPRLVAGGWVAVAGITHSSDRRGSATGSQKGRWLPPSCRVTPAAVGRSTSRRGTPSGGTR